MKGYEDEIFETTWLDMAKTNHFLYQLRSLSSYYDYTSLRHKKVNDSETFGRYVGDYVPAGY